MAGKFGRQVGLSGVTQVMCSATAQEGSVLGR